MHQDAQIMHTGQGVKLRKLIASIHESRTNNEFGKNIRTTRLKLLGVFEPQNKDVLFGQIKFGKTAILAIGIQVGHTVDPGVHVSSVFFEKTHNLLEVIVEGLSVYYL